MKLVGDLNYIQIGVAALHEQLIVAVKTSHGPSFDGNGFVDLTDTILTAWSRVVLGLEHGPVNQLTPVLSHLLLMDYPKILAHKLGIDRNNFDEFVPQREYLGTNDIDVVDQLIRELIRIQCAGSPDRQRHQGVAPGSQDVLAHALVSLLLALELVILRNDLVYLSIFTHSHF